MLVSVAGGLAALILLRLRWDSVGEWDLAVGSCTEGFELWGDDLEISLSPLACTSVKLTLIQ